MTPLSIKEIETHFTDLGEKKCPCCGNDAWGVHTDGAGTSTDPSLRALPHVSVRAADHNTLGVAIDDDDGETLIVAVFECARCGFLYFFNYYAILDKMRGVDDNW
jgi:hypothetical protein